jgi:6-phosphogluconolactonase/glucosamine-6-phosphate isomerase/deaminase
MMLRALAEEDIPWAGVHVVQVDERVAPDGLPDRNLMHSRESLLQHASLRPEQIHAVKSLLTSVGIEPNMWAVPLSPHGPPGV